MQVVADFNPAESRRIKTTCTYAEIAESYKSKMTGANGVGYKYPDAN